MARIDVSTWEQFVEAWKNTSGGDIIEINADLDVNDDIPSSEIDDREGAVSGGVVVINGNGHTLYNLAGGNPYSGYIFDSTYHAHQFNKLNFQNMDLTRPAFLGYSSGSYVLFNDCNIQGRSSGVPFFGNYITLNRCTCTFTNTTSVITEDHTNFTYCWIWLKNCRKIWGGSGAALIRHLNTCYIKGDVTYGTDSGIYSDAVEDVQNCCFNVTINASTFSGVTADYFCYNANGAKITIINKDKLPSGTTASDDPQAIAVTDEQMKNATYLASIGFDIVAGGDE